MTSEYGARSVAIRPNSRVPIMALQIRPTRFWATCGRKNKRWALWSPPPGGAGAFGVQGSRGISRSSRSPLRAREAGYGPAQGCRGSLTRLGMRLVVVGS